MILSALIDFKTSWFRASVVDWVVIILFMGLVPPPLFWLIIHPAIHYWRSLGRKSYFVAVLVFPTVAVIVYQMRTILLAHRIKPNVVTVLLGVACLYFDLITWRNFFKDFGLEAFVGLPELEPGNHPKRLVTTGVYARVRHPRYLGYLLLPLAFFLITGAVSLVILFLLLVILFYLVTLYEEKELTERFGQEYRDYRKRVPRFIPDLFH